jgi:hypothetical protein
MIHKDTPESFWERMRMIHGEDVGPGGRTLHYTEVPLEDATTVSLPEEGIRGPINEMGQECPWPWEPPQLAGAPMGQYHCPYCGGMVIAGMEHGDHTGADEHYARYAMREQGIPPRNWREYGIARLR